jgi:DNA-directed RNA polymerase subunit RPC12/RpoP
MMDYTEKHCSHCGQRLRLPKDIGGIVMVCPTCGNKFHSDFKLGGIRRRAHAIMLTNIFEWPYATLKRIAGFLASRRNNK